VNELRRHWILEDETVFLNHGSFGACPRPVLEAQARLRERMEREPARFFTREAPELLGRAREALGAFVGADPDDLAFVPNVTSALNAVLRSFPLRPGDEILLTDHEYNATRNAAVHAAQERAAGVRVAQVPFPLPGNAGSEAVVAAVLEQVGPRTRLAVLDHVTSATGLVFPIGHLVSELRARDVEVLVDGAHAPGMLPLDLRALGAAFYAANCHKWLCAPKGVGFLWVRRDLRAGVRPAVISHGANAPIAPGRDRFRAEFDWTGTDDPTPALCVPDALRFLATVVPGGAAEVRERNHRLALEARRIVADALGTALPCRDDLIGSLASLPVPPSRDDLIGSLASLPVPPSRDDLIGSLASLPVPPGVGLPGAAASSALGLDPLHEALYRRGIQVPVVSCPAHPGRLLRVSAALYNERSDYERLAAALRELGFGR
jgi:isopenicillin-N epimerase